MAPARVKPMALAVLVISLTGCAASARPSFLHPQAAAGQRYAQAVCGRCHAVGPGARGRNPHAPPFEAIARDYNDYRLSMEFDAIARAGHFEMGAFVIPPEERRALTAYILRLKASRAGAAPP